MTKLAPRPSPHWPTGVYLFGEDILRVGIVVASELPRDRTSLLVRLMAAGPLLAPAIAEVAALPPDAYERSVAEPILLEFEQLLGQNPSKDPQEQEFIIAMLKSWEQRKAEGLAEGRVEGLAEGRVEGLAEGRVEGLAEGRAEGQAAALLTVLDARGIAVPKAARARILVEKDVALLTRWIQRAASSASIADVIDETASPTAAPAVRPAARRGRRPAPAGR